MAPLPSMQGGRRIFQFHLHGALMERSWRSILSALLLISITFHSPQPVSANEASHKVSHQLTE